MNEIEIKEYTLPQITINDYDKLLELAKQDNSKYEKYIVTKSTLDDDTKKRAELNKMAKAINDRRLEIAKQISEPINEFKTKCDVLVNLYKKSSDNIDKQIKVFEEQEKNQKHEIIKNIFDENVKELKDVLSLDKIFDTKWLNKGSFKEDKFLCEKELIEKIDKVRNDLTSISDLNSKYEVELKTDYLCNFDLSQVISKNNDLIQKEQLLKRQQEETKKVQEEEKQEEIKEMITTPVKKEEVDPIQTYTLKITGRYSCMVELLKFIKLNGIEYERVDK